MAGTRDRPGPYQPRLQDSFDHGRPPSPVRNARIRPGPLVAAASGGRAGRRAGGAAGRRAGANVEVSVAKHASDSQRGKYIHA